MNPKTDLKELIDRAVRERELCEDKIVEYEARIQEINGFLNYIEKTLGDFAIKKDGSNSNLPIHEDIPSTKDTFEEMPVSKVAEIVLREHGKPMQVKDMVHVLWRREYKRYKTKQKLYTTLFTTMSRRKNFFKGKGRGIFGLTEWKQKETAPSVK